MSERLRILVVDDEPLMLKLIAETLSVCGADVMALSESSAAALLIRLEKFDGIFLDLMMPDVSGLELAREVRKSPCNRNTPIVIVTGDQQSQVMSKVFAAGATFLLHKPVDRKKLTKLYNSISGIMAQEKRRFARVLLPDTTATCHRGQDVFEGRIVEISESEVVLQGDGSLAKDQKLKLRFQFRGQGAPIEAWVTVTQADGRQQATCEFTSLAEVDRETIRKMINDFVQGSAALLGW